MCVQFWISSRISERWFSGYLCSALAEAFFMGSTLAAVHSQNQCDRGDCCRKCTNGLCCYLKVKYEE